VDIESFYLDYNATSPLSPSVIDWLKSGEVVFANPASQHSSGKNSRKIINQSKKDIFRTFNKSEKDNRLFFHSGATESFLTYAYSFSEVARKSKRKLLICYSKIDHPAVTSLADRFWGEGVEFFELSLKKNLSYDHQENYQSLQAKKKSDPTLIILYHHLWVHNETGFVSPLEELAKFKEFADLYLHIDAVQAPGKIETWRDLSVGDIWSFSAHKFGAFKGIGFSLMKRDLPFFPLISGGGQQEGLRAGTENPQGIMSISLALSDLEKVDISDTRIKKSTLEKFLENELQDLGAIIKSDKQNSNTIYFYLNDLTSDISLALFDLHGLMISAGSACSSGAAKPSAILTQLGHHAVARNGLRISLNFSVNDEYLKSLEHKLSAVIKRLRSS
jgi:cysteine desulfurase